MTRRLVALCFTLLISAISSFVVIPSSRQVAVGFQQWNSALNDDSMNDEPSNEDCETIKTKTVKINAKGDDVSDRFKYKVNALMGVFDPPAEVDNERENGNILAAMLKFPVQYSFNVVGKTEGDETKRDVFVDQVKSIVLDGSSELDKEGMACVITPRGKKFTKITIEAQVESPAMITNIYEELEQLDMSVMQF